MIKGKKAPSHSLFTELVDRQIIHGLALEYEHVLLFLNPKTASKMKKPLFRLNASHRRLGSWDAAKREISISRHHALVHSWYSIRAVLRHEMAHQMADEVFGAQGESAHGPTFHKACKLLRANPNGTHDPADRLADNRAAACSREDRLFDRIKKLMALSNSENAHEAAAALTKAHELILKYNLPLLKGHATPSYTTMFLGQPALRHYRESYLLAHLLQDFYFVEGLWVSSYVLEKGKMGRVFEISGTSANVKIAAYVYQCVWNYIERQWEKYAFGQKLGRYRKSDFSAGIITGFHQKLSKEKYYPALSSDEKALVLKGDPQLKKFMSERYPHTRSVSRSKAAMNPDIYSKGLDRGKRLCLLQGIEIHSKAKIKQIKH